MMIHNIHTHKYLYIHVGLIKASKNAGKSGRAALDIPALFTCKRAAIKPGVGAIFVSSDNCRIVTDSICIVWQP